MIAGHNDSEDTFSVLSGIRFGFSDYGYAAVYGYFPCSLGQKPHIFCQSCLHGMSRQEQPWHDAFQVGWVGWGGATGDNGGRAYGASKTGGSHKCPDI